MATDANRTFLIGRMVRDPELRYTQNGTAVASFSLANNRVYMANGEKKEQVSFFPCVAWGKLGETIHKYMRQGSQLQVEGRLQQRSWKDSDEKPRSIIEVVVENCQFLNSPKRDEGRGAPVPEPSYIPPNTDINPFTDDDIPF